MSTANRAHQLPTLQHSTLAQIEYTRFGNRITTMIDLKNIKMIQIKQYINCCCFWSRYLLISTHVGEPMEIECANADIDKIYGDLITLWGKHTKAE